MLMYSFSFANKWSIVDNWSGKDYGTTKIKIKTRDSIPLDYRVFIKY